MKLNGRNKVRNRGVSMLYTVVIMFVMLAFCSLAVDVARVQVAKTELRRAVDASARFGAMGLDIDGATAINNALLSPADELDVNNIRYNNYVDGHKLTLVPAEDIVIGKWDVASRKFTPVAPINYNTADAVQVNGKLLKARGTAVPLSFATVLGMPTCDIKTVSAIAKITKSVNVNQNVPATANPFLAGMPRGSVASLNNPHNSPDYAGDSSNPKQSPLQVAMPVTDTTSLPFDSISGDARHDPNLAYFSPDGELGAIGHNTNGSENGISDMNAPINALVGLFLDDSAPNTNDTPVITGSDQLNCPTDYSTADARNMQSYSPKLKQMFFIGDGKTDAGVVQTFKAPKGATRLYLATWDFYEWNNNAGQRNVRVIRPASVQLVK